MKAVLSIFTLLLAVACSPNNTGFHPRDDPNQPGVVKGRLTHADGSGIAASLYLLNSANEIVTHSSSDQTGAFEVKTADVGRMRLVLNDHRGWGALSDAPSTPPA